MATENIIMAMVKAGGNRQVQMQCLKYLCSWPGVCLLRNKGSWALVLSHLSLLPQSYLYCTGAAKPGSAV